MSDCLRFLAGFPYVVTIPILWGDQDAFGHVNNLTYLRWCETARVEYMRRLGLFPDLPPQGPGIILASIRCDYKLPLTHPDTVHVGARIVRIGNSSIQMEHRVVSENENAVAAQVDSTLVMFDYSRGEPMRVPDDARKRIGALEGKSFES